jgi:hypothetical protein
MQLGTERRLRAVYPAIAIAFAAAAYHGPAYAEETASNKVAAQALFDQAKDLLARNNAAEACPKLEESQRLDPTSGTLINLADCYERAGRIATAWSTFLQAAAAAKVGGHLEREHVAKERASALAQRLPKIAIQVEGGDVAGLEIRRDGAIVGSPQWGMAIPTDPGKHPIVATAPGRTSWESVVTVRDGENISVTVPALVAVGTATAVAPSAPERTSSFGTQRTLALVAGGVGVAGLTFGSVFGLVSKSKHDEANAHCNGSVCRDQLGVDLRGEATRTGNLSTAGFVLGALGLAGGAALWLTATSDVTSGSAPRVGVGVGSIVVTKAW